MCILPHRPGSAYKWHRPITCVAFNFVVTAILLKVHSHWFGLELIRLGNNVAVAAKSKINQPVGAV